MKIFQTANAIAAAARTSQIRDCWRRTAFLGALLGAEDGSDALTSADAGRRNAVAAAAFAQFVKRRYG
jgi:hypothetical protein